MSSGIYEIRHNASGRRYIGSAIDFESRWKLHQQELRRGTHHSAPLQNAWNKYGATAFSFNALEACAKGDLLAREQAWLDEVQPFQERGFNVCPTAGSKLGWKTPPETKAKMSAAAKGRTFSPETLEKMRLAKLGKKPSQACVDARIAALKGNQNTLGFKHSAETRQKMSALRKGRACTWGAKISATKKAKAAAAAKDNGHEG